MVRAKYGGERCLIGREGIISRCIGKVGSSDPLIDDIAPLPNMPDCLAG